MALTSAAVGELGREDYDARELELVYGVRARTTNTPCNIAIRHVTLGAYAKVNGPQRWSW
jgi:hypothetical protein